MKYFTDSDRDQLIFFQVPKILLLGEKYKDMKPNTKLLYMVLIDRVKLSIQKGWKDEGKYYVRMSAQKAAELLHLSESTFKRAKTELEKYELLEQKQEGLTKTNKLFIGQLDYSDDDIIKISQDMDDMLEEAENQAQAVDAKQKGQNEPSGKSLKGQNEPTEQNQLKGQNEPSRKVKMTLHEGSKRTTINNDFNNNKINKKYIVNKGVNKEETINNLISEYRLKGMSKELCLRVLDEVEEKRDIENFGGYLRTCLETALHKSQVKHGLKDPAEKLKELNIPLIDFN